MKLCILGTLVGAVAVGGVVISGAVGGPLTTKPVAVDTRGLAADLLGVPESELQRAGPDLVLTPPALAPPSGEAYRRWCPIDSYGASAGSPRPKQASVNQDGTSISATWLRPALAPPLSNRTSERQAKAIAAAFLGRRGLLAGLRLKAVRVEASDKTGQATRYDVAFDTPSGAPGARISVDAVYGFVASASRYSQEIPPASKPPVMTLDVARAMVLRELARRSIDATIQRGWLWTKCPGFQVGHPVFMFRLLVRTKDPGGRSCTDQQAWYVDGWDRRVGRSVDFPEVRRWNHEILKWPPKRAAQTSAAK